MRTLHVATAPTWRGGEQQVLYLLQGLDRRGLAPVVATPPGSPLARKAEALGVEVRPLRSRGDFDPVAALRLRRSLGGGFDVLHLHTGHAHALGLLATVAMERRPRIVVSRRVDFRPGGGPVRPLKYGARVDRFLTVSHRVGGVLIAAGVPASRVTTVHSGVDPARMQVPRDPEGLRRELGVPSDVKLVGFVGALVPHKSPGDFLEAAARLPEHVHAVVAGAGEMEGRLRRRSEAPDLRSRVHFLGQRDDVPRLIRSLDVFCLSSRLEGLGTTVLDAMAAGTPVVAAAAGGIPEVVQDGTSGLLATPGQPPELAECLRRVLEDPNLAAGLAAGGRIRVQAFTAERMVEATLGVYQELTAGRRGAEAPAPR